MNFIICTLNSVLCKWSDHEWENERGVFSHVSSEKCTKYMSGKKKTTTGNTYKDIRWILAF